MNASRRIPRADRRGFTLVELLIVLGILVALAALVVPSVLNSRKKAEIRNAKAQILLFSEPLELYKDDCREYPSTEDGLNALIREPSEVSGGKWQGPYLKGGAIPKDPWGEEYQYAFPSTHGSDSPDIWSKGPDREDGSDDDIVSWSSEEGGAGEGDKAPIKGKRPDRPVKKGPSEPTTKKAGAGKSNGGKNLPPAEPTSGKSTRGAAPGPISSPKKGDSPEF